MYILKTIFLRDFYRLSTHSEGSSQNQRVAGAGPVFFKKKRQEGTSGHIKTHTYFKSFKIGLIFLE